VKEYPYWWDTIPKVELKTEKVRVLPSKVDVAVVGGGYTGLSAARHLARVGASVVVLEREDVGWGASSRNGGQVLTGLRLDPGTLVERYGEAAARRLFEASLDSMVRLETLIASEAIDCGYTQSGHIHAASKPSHFEDLRKQQTVLTRVFRHRVELVSRNEQRSGFRIIPLYGEDVKAGVFEKRFVLWPLFLQQRIGLDGDAPEEALAVFP